MFNSAHQAGVSLGVEWLSPGKYAIVTPYLGEEKKVIQQCCESVARQTIKADHFLIADGSSQDWIDDLDVRHIKLDMAHADYGNTPRTIGALLAISEGYSGIAFLDSDNWFEPDHIEMCITAASQSPCVDYVIAKRHIRRADGTLLNIPDEPLSAHVDTNCLFFLPGSFHVIPHFALMPRRLSAVGDRLFFAALRAAKLVPAVVSKKTVNYRSTWQAHYRAAGELPPPGTKPSKDVSPINAWIAGMTERERAILNRLVGVTFGADDRR